MLNSTTLCKADFRTVAPDLSGSTGVILVGMLAMTSVAVPIFRDPPDTLRYRDRLFRIFSCQKHILGA
ncbi:hypothetical protein [Algoriphagus boritolerans]|uniref:hypothetical protein n=1 Tax=Algoriphagus boritolerans TaxID=308111 RepID=UPI0011B0DC5F|nr:hypothetical protein [Algoriphagus boritolerans]